MVLKAALLSTGQRGGEGSSCEASITKLGDGKRFIEAVGFELYRDYSDVHSGCGDADNRSGFREVMRGREGNGASMSSW